MPLPVIANVFQETLVWTNPNAPRPATNVLHWFDTAGGQTDTDLYNDTNASVIANMWTTVSSGGAISSINVIKLDGTSAGQVFSNPVAAKWTGQGSADAILQGATVVSLKSAVRGPRGRNRVFLPWTGEGQQLNGTVDPSAVTQATTAWNTFTGSMNSAGWELVAVSGLHSTAAVVTSVVVRSALKTQRRRARR